MGTYALKQRELPLDDQYDVIVAGGGPSGCTAAIASAREGARTLLVEATGALGGMGTAGLVPAWCPFTDGERVLYAGLAEKVLRASKAGFYRDDPERLNWVPIDPPSPNPAPPKLASARKETRTMPVAPPTPWTANTSSGSTRRSIREPTILRNCPGRSRSPPRRSTASGCSRRRFSNPGVNRRAQ